MRIFTEDSTGEKWAIVKNESRVNDYQIYPYKPKTPIDLSVVVDSRIPMLFGPKSRPSTLAKIEPGESAALYRTAYSLDNNVGSLFSECEFDTSENAWIPWFGGKCPYPEGVVVDIVTRNGNLNSGEACEFRWCHDPALSNGQIIAAKANRLGLSYCYPWE